MADPLATVWIPSYNHGRWLAETIESALAQTYDNVEVVLVDDGSTDDSIAVAERYVSAHPDRIRLLTHSAGAHHGLSATANLAVRASRGDYLAGVPSDDVIAPHMVERHIAVLEADRSLMLSYGYARVVDAEGKPTAHSLLGEDVNRHPRPFESLLHANRIPGATVLVRREAFLRFVPRLYHESVVYCDWEAWIRLAAHGPIAFVPSVVAHYRMHGANLTVETDSGIARARSLEVLQAVEAEADEIGGELERPRSRAALRLELALRCYRGGDFDEAAQWASAALRVDPSLTRDGKWLGRWLIERLDRTGPPDDFAAWLLARTGGDSRSLVRPLASLRLEQESRAAERRGQRGRASTLAVRSLLNAPARALEPPFLRLIAKLAVGPRLTAVIRRYPR